MSRSFREISFTQFSTYNVTTWRQSAFKIAKRSRLFTFVDVKECLRLCFFFLIFPILYNLNQVAKSELKIYICLNFKNPQFSLDSSSVVPFPFFSFTFSLAVCTFSILLLNVQQIYWTRVGNLRFEDTSENVNFVKARDTNLPNPNEADAGVFSQYLQRIQSLDCSWRSSISFFLEFLFFIYYLSSLVLRCSQVSRESLKRTKFSKLKKTSRKKKLETSNRMKSFMWYEQ